MLPLKLWSPTEPRLIFPVFAGMENVIDLTLQPGPRRTWRDLARPAYNHYRRGKPLGPVLRDYWNLVFDPAYRFRGCYLDRDGKLLLNTPLPGRFREGGYFSVQINQWLQDNGVPQGDGAFILVANRGRTDLWNSSPGNASLRVISPTHVTGFRTGFFTRSLNDGKKHFGFTGLNPQVVVDDQVVASLMLINHSSEPSYNSTVAPTVKLHRSPEEFIEAPFGEIPPFGTRERGLSELFPQAQEFLKPTQGRGFSVAQCKGSTLASIHVFRDKSGAVLSMDHSRPAHTNIVDYL